jgi:two-component system cell cycle response regulator
MNNKPLARILLVEDDLALASAYQVRMEAENFDVLHCPNGEEAMQKALEYHPDLILLDLMMPKISGFDVLDILRNTPATAHTKIIILTALSQPSDQARAKDLGADEFLVKSQAVISDVMKRIRFHLAIKEPDVT